MVEKLKNKKIVLYAYGVMYKDNNGIIKDKIIGPLNDLNDPRKLKEFKLTIKKTGKEPNAFRG